MSGRWQGAYEAFGTRTAEDGETEERQMANTKNEDPTGLLNEGFRYRDLEAGVWLTRDPAGFVDGPNVYTYVRQNPWTKFDPYGLWETGSYCGDVGQVFVGYGRAIKGTAVGLYTVVRHPIQTAKGIKAAASDPAGTFNAIKNEYADKLESNAGVGEVGGEFLIGLATGGSLKAVDKAGDVADIANKANKATDAADAAGDSARTTQKVSQEAVEASTKKTTQSGYSVTEHSVQQKINREVRSADELQALKDPLKVEEVKVDSQGRPSQRHIGEKAETVINPETKKIVSINPTSTKKAERLKRQEANEDD